MTLSSLQDRFCLWSYCGNSLKSLFGCLWSCLWQMTATAPQKGQHLLPPDLAVYHVLAKGFLLYCLSARWGLLQLLFPFFTFSVCCCFTLFVLFRFSFLLLCTCWSSAFLIFHFLPVFHYYRGFSSLFSSTFFSPISLLPIVFLLSGSFCSSITLWQQGAACRNRTSWVMSW